MCRRVTLSAAQFLFDIETKQRQLDAIKTHKATHKREKLQS